MNWNKFTNNGVYRLPKQGNKTHNGLNKNSDYLQQLAIRANNNIPKSKQWFRDLFIPHIIDFKKSYLNDTYNKVIGSYIADLANKEYMYCVHIDNKPTLELNKKVLSLQKRGYTVIHVQAYNNTSFQNALLEILKLRNK